MSLLNSKTIILLVLAAVASWNFPWGVVVDVGIIAVWILVKRKKAPGAAAKVAPGQVASGDESIKLLAMAMLSDRVNASGNAAAASLGLPPAPALRKIGRPAPSIDSADRAAKMRLLE